MKKYSITGILILLSLVAVSIHQYFRFYDNKLHVVFCDVGQGDAIFITTPNHKHILIDAGPDRKVLDCLSHHTAFWERDLDLVFLTHPHADHESGIYYVMDRYITKSFDTNNITLESSGFKDVKKLIAAKKIPVQTITAGDLWRIGDVTLSVNGPDEKWLKNIGYAGADIGKTENASLILSLTYGEFQLLLTGDSQSEELLSGPGESAQDIDVLQVPHHGSATGTTRETLSKIQPELAVISVGGKNSYNLPNTNVLKMLSEQGIKVLRTDKSGDIEIMTDGKGWEVK